LEKACEVHNVNISLLLEMLRAFADNNYFPKEELDKLNRILRNEQGIRVKYCGERKFKAYNNSGKVVLEKTF
jgi:hypothetical protein